MLHIGIPVMDQVELTSDLLWSLDKTVVDPESLHVVVIDNGSSPKYNARMAGVDKHPYRVSLVRNDRNLGYYWPLMQVMEFAGPGDLVGLMHNDLWFYEQGWDRRLREQFVHMGELGMVGFCGSGEVDDRGGRGGDTKCFFRGERGQDQSCGRRIYGLEPACLLDSLFMVMRFEAVRDLGVDAMIAPCHFYDKIWPMRLIAAGWRVGVLGVEIDHRGGKTSVELASRWQADAREWCLRVGVDPGDDPLLAVYLEAERRFLTEFREKGWIPGRMDGWRFRPQGRPVAAPRAPGYAPPPPGPRHSAGGTRWS